MNAGGLRWKDLNHLSNTTGNSFVDAEGNLVLDGLAVEFAEVALAA